MAQFDVGFDAGFDIDTNGGVIPMAIDPDVQTLLDAVNVRLDALEQQSAQQPSQITLTFPDGTTVSYNVALT